jgi:hypothetical protein
MRMKRRTYRRLRALSLVIIALALLGIIGGALSGSPSRSSALPKPTPTPVLARASATSGTRHTRARHRRHRHRRRITPVVAVATTPAAAPTPAGCHPLSDEGTCYEPGEYCRYDDEGMTGVAGDGETITCEDNDGWRWEPS